MADTIMPAFLECPAEAATIGRILASYGELEFILCRALAKPLGTIEAGIKTLFKARMGEKQRLQTAAAHLAPYYASIGISTEWDQTLEAVKECRNIRNAFAHATWAVNDDQHLFYVDLGRTSRLSRPALQPMPIDVSTLAEIEAYFVYARDCLRYLDHIASRFRNRRLTMPPKKCAPKRHSPRRSPPIEPPPMTPIR